MKNLGTTAEGLDFEALCRDLLRELRGKRSQAAWSKRQGYASNVAYLWETGRRLPDASTFLRLAATDKRLLALSDFVRQPLQLQADASGCEVVDVGWLLRELAGNLTTSALSRRVGVDRSTLSRWLQGQTLPRLPEFLRFVEATSGRLLDFLAIFVDPRRLASAKAAYDYLQHQRRIAYEQPWSHAVLHALSVHHGPDQVRRIADTVGLSRSAVREQLAALERAGVVQRAAGRYEAKAALTVDTSHRPELDYQLKHHWAAVGLERLERTRAKKSGLFSYNLFPIAARDFTRLRQLHLEYFEQVRKLVANARGADRVVLVNVQLVPLDE